MNILLFNPPETHQLRGSVPAVLESNRGYNPPLGLLFIAGVLERLGHSVTVIDAQVEELTYKEVDKLIEATDYDLLGLTVMTFTLIDSLKVSEISKKHNPDTPVVWGGTHLHIYPEETASMPEIDYVITGEGEVAIAHLCEYLTGGREWTDVDGVGTTADGKYLFNRAAAPVEDLDSLPFPARHLTKYKKYNSILAKSNVVTTMFTSRGCPYKCSFCDRPALRPNFRFRSALSVVDELEECVKLGINEFIFYDDTFTVNRKRVSDICDEIIRRKLKIYWDCRTNINAINKDLLIKMHAAGCVGVHYGVEAGTKKIQKVLRKNLNLDKVQKMFDDTRAIGIKVMAYWIIGNPTETRADVEEGFRFLQKLNADFVHIGTLMPFPATEIYLTGLRKGIIKYDYWKEYAKNPDENFVAPHWPEIFSESELSELIVAGYKWFYLRPQYIFRRIMQIRSFSELWRNIKIGVGIVFMKSKEAIISRSSFFNFDSEESPGAGDPPGKKTALSV